MWRVLLLSLLIMACGGGPTKPTPPRSTPSPTATPSLPPTYQPIVTPLRVSGRQFIAGGVPVRLAGAIFCCGPPGDSSAEAWPLIDHAGLERIAAHRGNYCHVRTGPYWDEPDAVMILPGLLDYARVLGIYCEVDLLDGWGAKTGNLEWREDGCWIFRTAPQARHEEHIRRVVRATAMYVNVVYQVGNETGVCGTTPEWEWGVRAIAQDEMGKMGVFRLVGTNSQDPEIEARMDYASYHNRTPSELVAPWPVQMNEVNPPNQPEDFCRYLEEAEALGVYYHLWRGWPWLNDEKFQRSLNCLAGVM